MAPPKVGDKAANFTAIDTDRKPRSLAEFLGKKIVLAFFPGAFTGVCTKEMCAIRDSMSKFEQLGAMVVAVSVDAPFSNKAFMEQYKLTFPVLSDFTREVGKAYDTLHHDFAGLKGYSALKRSVFVLDQNGVIEYSWVSDDPGKEPPYDQIIKVVGDLP